MAYDPMTDQLLIVARRESGGGSPFKLWTAGATFDDEPDRLKLDDKKAFDDVEGVALDETGVLFVRDDGESRKAGVGSWFYLTREALDMERETR